MALDKNAIKGIGLLAFVGVLVASGFFVVKPQIEESFTLISDTSELRESTEMREIRLAKLQGENEHMDDLADEINQLLKRVPSEKNVTDIAGAVIEAMPPGVQLLSFSHGELVNGVPSYTVPKSSLENPAPPFTLVTPGSQSAPADKEATDEDSESTPKKSSPTTPVGTPASAMAPFILEVRASGVESLTNFLDVLQFQDRLITVVSVNSSSSDGGETTATIYGYAFAGSNAAIQAWENPPADEEE